MHCLLYWLLFFSMGLFTALLGTVCTVWVFLLVWRGWARYLPPGKVRTGVVLGSGGHTTEMIKIVNSLDRSVYTPRTYYVSDTDSFSLGKLESMERNRRDYCVVRIPRSREVKQSYITSVISTLRSMVASFPLVLADQPQLMLVNGPGTCVPVALMGWILTHFRLHTVTLVYVESLCRVKTLSLSGKILQYVADEVLVQWPELQTKYPRTKYIGNFL